MNTIVIIKKLLSLERKPAEPVWEKVGLLMTNMSINRVLPESYHRILTKSKPHATIIPNKRRKIHESKI